MRRKQYLLMKNGRFKMTSPTFVACVDNSGYPTSLELHEIYQTVPDEGAARDGDLRVIDEIGEDYVYPANRLVAIDIPKALELSILRAR
jgi:hypothetical protein